MSDWLNREHMLGYLDGLKAETPEPSDNRSLAYKHSFWLGRNELTGTPLWALKGDRNEGHS